MWICHIVSLLLSLYLIGVTKGERCNGRKHSFTIATDEGVPIMSCLKSSNQTVADIARTLEQDDAEEPQIYWKDFNGPPVPEDAILAGYGSDSADGEPRPTYLGQTLVPATGAWQIQPVAIFNDSSVAYYTYGTQTYSAKNIKVLCSNVPPERMSEFLKWVPVKDALAHYKSQMVVAGREGKPTKRYDLYFARRYTKSQFFVGKTSETAVLYNPWINKELASYNPEVLLFANKK